MKIPKICKLLPVLSLLFFSCASAPRIIHEGRNIPEDFAGIVHAGETQTQREYDYLNYVGANWKLHTFYWNRIEPEQGKWDFQFYDTVVDMGKAAGIKTLGILAYDNWWIHADQKSHSYISPEQTPHYLEYVRKTVEHFRGRVDAWCIWNEPNFHFWNGTDEEFFELSRRAADAVREVDSEVILLGGAFNRGIFGLPKKFIRGLFDSGAMEKVDAVAFHPYELNPARTARLYDQFKKIVDDYGFGDKIWVTEAGYPTGGWYPTKVSENKFPAYVIKTWTLLAARGAQKIFWYQLFDPEERKSGNSEDFFGLVRSKEDYSSKGAEAFRLCAEYLSGTTCYTSIPWLGDLPNSIRAFYFEGDGRSALILWNDSLGVKNLNLRLPGAGHISHDPVTGETSAIPPETIVKTGNMPVFITW